MRRSEVYSIAYDFMILVRVLEIRIFQSVWQGTAYYDVKWMYCKLYIGLAANTKRRGIRDLSTNSITSICYESVAQQIVQQIRNSEI